TLNNYQSKEDLLFNIPSVNINEELIKEIKSRIDSGNILHRPLPPWDKDKHIEIEDIDKKIECKEIIHPLDREIINHRIENLDLNLQEKNNLELLRNGIECSGWFVHKRAIRDYLKRYNIFFESEKHRAVNRVNGNSIFDSIIINGKTQKDWIRTRNNN
ncbi:hypothetical protein, partial [Shewanella sp. c952]|uniref:hypothetical protein n=1 Tax=Shewanella sp. c952 TaxID=2815913 RepID=UPI001C7D628A